MSGRISIMPTEFRNVATDEEGQFSLGFRAYDDQGQCYDNTLANSDSTPDELLKFYDAAKDGKAFLTYILEHNAVNDTLQDMLTFSSENQKTIDIGLDSLEPQDYQGILKDFDII